MTARHFPRWLIWLGIPVAAVALLVTFWSWDWFIPLVQRQASAALGRPVTIAHLHVRLGRVTEITVEDLRVANPEGFPGDPPFAQVPRATAQLDVMAYWHDRAVVIPSIEVERPAVQVLALEDGRNNYSFSVGTPAGENAAPQQPSAAPRIGLLRIRDGQAHVAIPKLRADFQLAINTREEDGPAPRIAVEANGTYAGQRITGQLLGGAVLDLQNQQRPWPVAMELHNGPTVVNLEGTVANLLELQGVDVRTTLAGPDMALLEPLTGVPFPKTPNYRLNGRLDYADGRVRLRDFDGRVGSSDLSGTITVTTGGERPDVTADLRSRRVDLADLGGFIGEEPGRTSTPGQTAAQRRQVAREEASARVLPDDPINMPKLTGSDVHLKYRGERIQGRNIPFDNLSVDMDIVNGVVTLHPIALGVGPGRIAGEITLTPQPEDALRARADIQFQRLDVSRLMQATGTFQGAGTLNGRAQIEGTGKSLAGILGTGNGALTIAMSGGGNLSALLVDLSGLRIANSLLSFFKLPDRTVVQCFVGDFALQRGVLNTRALFLDTEPVLITGSGNIDLRRERLDYRLESESKHFTVGQLPAPITIDGTFRNPDIGIEAAELVARGGAAGALAALAAPLAILPTIQFGIGEDNRCEGIAQRAQRGAPARNRASQGNR
ncbi:AsmA family protein [Roseomonas sp. BN140053]|uniref:AsmA family protein n=1 Tax=Roseomonas sp. BN140053 TaxID=3391898 RepID=UPI0039EBC75B